MPRLLFARRPADGFEERKIRKLVGSRHAPADWIQRAKIITMSWDGHRVPVIAVRLGCAEKTVRYRLARFNAEGFAGLGDRPGAGRKRRITEGQRALIVELASRSPWDAGAMCGAEDRAAGADGRAGGADGRAGGAAGRAPGSRWTLDSLTMAVRARGIEVRRSQVRRILLAARSEGRPESAVGADPGAVSGTVIGERSNGGRPRRLSGGTTRSG